MYAIAIGIAYIDKDKNPKIKPSIAVMAILLVFANEFSSCGISACDVFMVGPSLISLITKY